MPQGFRQPDKVLRLKRSLYGLKQSPLNFFKRLKEALENTGFQQSKNDYCLFIGKDVICV
jgi:Reverse transcriptase (RNA-dependent DNA polymerase)